jgi:hypothetical protein
MSHDEDNNRDRDLAGLLGEPPILPGRLKWRPFTVTRFLGNTRAAPKQALRMRAVDAEFIGLLTLIDRFPPTAPDRFCQVRGAFTPSHPR